jgi:hypothetical protein
VSVFPNTGFMGVPLLVALFGATVAGPMLTTMLIDIFITSSLCIALAQTYSPQGQGGGTARAAALRPLRGALSNPLPWSIALGGTLGALGWRPAGPVEAVIDAGRCQPGAVHHRRGVAPARPLPMPRRFRPQARSNCCCTATVFAGAWRTTMGATITDLQIIAILRLRRCRRSKRDGWAYGADNGRMPAS